MHLECHAAEASCAEAANTLYDNAQDERSRLPNADRRDRLVEGHRLLRHDPAHEGDARFRIDVWSSPSHYCLLIDDYERAVPREQPLPDEIKEG